MTQRLQYIDIAKGFAILCVVCGHVLCYDIYGFDRAWTDSNLMQFICTFHVPLFFFLSGLLSKSNIELKDIPRDIYKRFRTLIVPFFVIGSIYSLLNTGGFSYLTNEYKFGYWYFYVLFTYCVVNYPLLLIGKGKYKAIFYLIVSSVIWLLANHYIFRIRNNVSDYFSIVLIVKYFPYFAIGNVIKQAKLHEQLFGDSFIFLFGIIIWLFSQYISFKFSDIIITTAAIFVIINICKKFEHNAVIAHIGRSTLYIYAFHYFAIQLMRTTYFQTILPKYSNFFFDLLICILPITFAVAFSLGIKYIIEKEIKVNKLIFNK